MKSTPIPAFFVLLFSASCASSSPSAKIPEVEPQVATFEAKVDAIATRAIEKGATPSLSVMVWKKGAPPVIKAYGLANPEDNTLATTETLYQIGSLTKTFTSLAILQLVEEGKLSLESPVNELIGTYTSPLWKDLRLEHLLAHTSGIPAFTGLASFNITDPVSHQDIVDRVKDLPLRFVPGMQFDYSNTNYYLLGIVIEQITGKPYASVIKTRILEPAGMKDTGYCQNTPPLQEAQGTGAFEEGTWARSPRHEMSIPFAAGALCASSRDMFRWLKALQQGTLVKPETLAIMSSPRLGPDALPLPYGLGVFRGITATRPWFGHGGDIPGFTAQASIYPQDGLSIVLLSNTGGAPLHDIEVKLVREVLGMPEAPDVPKTLTQEAAAPYTGVFSGGGLEIVVREEEGSVSAQSQGQTVPLGYLGEGRFVSQKGSQREFHFERLEGTKLQMLTFHNRGIVFPLKRTQDDPPAPVVLTEVPLPEEQMALYLGQYKAAPGTLTLTHTENKIFIQLTGQSAFELMHTGEHAFVGRDLNHIRFVFNPPKEGSPSAFVTLYQGPATIQFDRLPTP